MKRPMSDERKHVKEFEESAPDIEAETAASQEKILFDLFERYSKIKESAVEISKEFNLVPSELLYYFIEKFGESDIRYAFWNLENQSQVLKATKISDTYGLNLRDIVNTTKKSGMGTALMAAKFYGVFKTLLPDYQINFNNAYVAWRCLKDKLQSNDYDAINPLEILVLSDTNLFDEVRKPSYIPCIETIYEAKGESVDDVATGYHLFKERDLRLLKGIPSEIRDALQNYFNIEYDAEREMERQDPFKQVQIFCTSFDFPSTMTEKELDEERIIGLKGGTPQMDIFTEGSFNPAFKGAPLKMPKHYLKANLGADKIVDIKKK